MKTVPLVVADTVNNSYQCYKVMADEDMTEVDVIAAINYRSVGSTQNFPAAKCRIGRHNRGLVFVS